MKAILLAAALHRARQLTLRAVVCNGGHQATERAKLARCLLDHVDTRDVPVGVGSEGVFYEPHAHEYELQGYAAVDESRLLPGGALLLRALRTAPRKSVRVVCISSLRDFCDVITAHPELVERAVHSVGVQGGLEPDAASPGGWRPDSSVNNTFDMAAAATVYAFCFEKGLPMTVVSRHAVPLLPMQLAKSCAPPRACSVLPCCRVVHTPAPCAWADCPSPSHCHPSPDCPAVPLSRLACCPLLPPGLHTDLPSARIAP